MVAIFSLLVALLVLAFFWFMAAFGARAPDPFTNPDPMPRRRRGSGVNQRRHEIALRAQISRERANLAEGRRAELAAAAPEEHAALRAQYAADDHSNAAWYDQAMAVARNRDRDEAGEI